MNFNQNDYEEWGEGKSRSGQRNAAVRMAVLMVLFLAVSAGILWFAFFSENAKGRKEHPNPPVDAFGEMGSEPTSSVSNGIVVVDDAKEEAQLLAAENEVAGTTLGIDVSRYQGTIDFEKVRGDGIDFVMVRIGYRTAMDGVITEDVNAAYNLQQAQASGLMLGAYFFSSAVTEEEAVEEADFVADFVAQYPITYPIAYDCEGYLDPDSRNFMLTTEKRTKIALAFLDRIAQRGYVPMFYGAKSEMQGNQSWDMEQIDQTYKVWVAQYPDKPYPQTQSSSYGGRHAMWQYANWGQVKGVPAEVDLNVAYFDFSALAVAKDPTPPAAAKPSAEAQISFSETKETVTAKITTNLRSWPSVEEGEIVHVLQNGEEVVRTGVSQIGWSRVEWQGQVLYAVTNYLTTDLSTKYEDPASSGGGQVVNMDGVAVQTPFAEANDRVTAKEFVNLRSLPSVSHEASRVIGTLNAGDVLTRTGINEDLGWSRLEYNGQTVYAITSYLSVVE